MAIEIGRSFLHAVIVDPPRRDETVRVRTRSIKWQHTTGMLYSEAGVRELTEAMKTLVSAEKLAGLSVSLSLNGDLCVTRVVTGTIDRVRRQLAILEQRSEHYLSLGSGPKSLATAIGALDARHQHALLSVTNGKTLDAVLGVASQLGLNVTLVEPSLVALSRLLGHAGRDVDSPALIVNLTENGVELGISHRGRLLLDYRPGGRFSLGEVADTVSRHLARLQRYCDRYYGYSEGTLSRVFLLGENSDVATVKAGFEKHEKLCVEDLNPAEIDLAWRFDSDGARLEHCAALGTCLLANATEESVVGPNLLERVQASEERPMVGQLLRSFWPAAAAALVAAILSVANWYEGSGVNALTRQLETLEADAGELWRLRGEMSTGDVKMAHLEAIEQGISDPSWSEVLSDVAGCMPADIWLDKFAVAADRRATLAGSSYREGTIYQFVSHLEPSPTLSQVAVEGTRPGMERAGMVTKFEIECEINDYSDSDKEPGRDD